MRTIKRSSFFKHDYKREAKGRYRAILDTALLVVLNALINDMPLATHYRDHMLNGEWLGYRDCHIKPDLILIYRKQNDNVLQLVRLGSHSELFG